MSRRLRVHHRTTKALTSTELSSAEPGLDFPGSLKLALRSYLRERYPDINLAAEISSSSVRTLQRRLARFGLSYSNLVQQTRIEVAAEMLENPSVTSIEVADAVGYADSSHFARAFQKHRRKLRVNLNSISGFLLCVSRRVTGVLA